MKRILTLIFSLFIFSSFTLFSFAYVYDTDFTTTQKYGLAHGIIIAIGLGLSIIVGTILKIKKSDEYIPLFVVIALTVVALLITSIKELFTVIDKISPISVIILILFFLSCVIFFLGFLASELLYFDAEKTSTGILIVFLSVFVLSTAVLCLRLNQTKVEAAYSKELTSELEDANKDIKKLQEKIDFYDSYVVFCDDSSNYYHKYDCYRWDINDFYAYNLDNAKEQGYKPCPECMK